MSKAVITSSASPCGSMKSFYTLLCSALQTHLDGDDLGARTEIDGRIINILKILFKKKTHNNSWLFTSSEDQSLAGPAPHLCLKRWGRYLRPCMPKNMHVPDPSDGYSMLKTPFKVLSIVFPFPLERTTGLVDMLYFFQRCTNNFTPQSACWKQSLQ